MTAEAEVQAPTDQAARDAIRERLDATLFVEAGAGSGKTTALVDRVVALVHDGVELARIAAITFTEKAGAELRDRIRRRLEEEVAAGGPHADLCAAALDQLDGAAIGTLHAFAQRILGEHPVEAGLPPRIEVLDEVASGIAFERRWSTFRDELLSNPKLERSLLLLVAAGAHVEALHVLARRFDDSWDLVDERVPADAPEPSAVLERARPALGAVRNLCQEVVDDCTDPADKLLVRVLQLLPDVETALACDDELDVLEWLRKLCEPTLGSVGRAVAHRRPPKELRGEIKEACAALGRLRAQVAEEAAHRIAAEIRRFTLAAAAERRVAGMLEFHDLLVLARTLVRHPDHGSAVRARLQERYARLLLDEFQDTDPIQIELAVRIAAADPAAEGAGTLPWDEVPLAPGRLFVVGDPKQSIYRFRRADIATFLAARDRVVDVGGDIVELTTSFRTGDEVIDVVNHAFDALFSEGADEGDERRTQPAYAPLARFRGPGPAGPGVAVLGAAAHPARTGADRVRALEAADVAAAVRAALDEGWEIEEERTGVRRPARPGDIAILVPARTSLPFLEDALADAGISYRTEASSLVYASRAVRDLFVVLRAIDDPTDRLRLVAALRTPLLGCGDDDLLRHKLRPGSSWSFLAPGLDDLPEDDPVARAMRWLRDRHRERHWVSPSAMVERAIDDLRAMELGFADGRPRDVWRRLRFVADQARAWTDATGGSLRGYLQWVRLQSAEGARVAEAVLPETDDDAVRILTIHAAKGLEFPITIVSGASSRPGGASAPAQVSFPPSGPPGYRFWGKVETQVFTDHQPIDEQMGLHERIRLLYVACTRARDHLVLSLHREERARAPQATGRTNAELLVAGLGDRLAALPALAAAPPADAVAPAAPPSGALGTATTPPPPEDRWTSERERIEAAGRRPTTVAATALTDEGTLDVDDIADATATSLDALVALGVGPSATGGEEDGATPDGAADGAAGALAGLAKRPRDLDLPPWLKGRYGSAIGRAVHGALQTIPLADPTAEEVRAAVSAQCEAESVAGREADVERLVRHALGSPAVARAAGTPHWKEVYACTPVGDRLLEGYIDLLHRDGDGLVVIDYKTAGTDDPAELDRRADGYRSQGAAYALALHRATGEPVVRVVFVFLTPSGAVERELADLDAAVEEIRHRIATVSTVVPAGV